MHLIDTDIVAAHLIEDLVSRLGIGGRIPIHDLGEAPTGDAGCGEPKQDHGASQTDSEALQPPETSLEGIAALVSSIPSHLRSLDFPAQTGHCTTS